MNLGLGSFFVATTAAALLERLVFTGTFLFLGPFAIAFLIRSHGPGDKCVRNIQSTELIAVGLFGLLVALSAHRLDYSLFAVLVVIPSTAVLLLAVWSGR